MFEINDLVRVYGIQDNILFNGQVGRIIDIIDDGRKYAIDFRGYNNSHLHNFNGKIGTSSGYYINKLRVKKIYPVGIQPKDIVVTEKNMYACFNGLLITKSGVKVDICNNVDYVKMQVNGEDILAIYNDYDETSDVIVNNSFYTGYKYSVYTRDEGWGNIMPSEW